MNIQEIEIAVIADKIGNYVHDLQDAHKPSDIVVALAWVVAHCCRHAAVPPHDAFDMFKERAGELLVELCKK